MKKHIIALSIAASLGLSGCGGETIDVSSLEADSNIDYNVDTGGGTVGDTTTGDISTKTFSTAIELFDGNTHSYSVKASAAGDGTFAFLFGSEGGIDDNLHFVEYSSDSGVTRNRILSDHFSDENFEPQKRPDLVKLNDGTYLIAYIGVHASLGQPAYLAHYNPSTDSIVDEILLSSETSENVTISTNGTAFFLSWYEGGKIKTAYFDGTEQIAAYSPVTATTMDTGSMHYPAYSFMSANGDVDWVYEIEDSVANTWDLKHLTYDKANTSWSTPTIIDASDDTIGDLSVIKKDGAIHAVWMQRPVTSYNSEVTYSKFDGAAWETPMVLSDITVNYSVGLPSIAAHGDKVGIVWIRDDGAFNSVHYRERTAGAWSEDQEIYDLGGLLPHLNFDSSGNAVLAFYNFHTQYATKPADGNWSIVSHASGLNGAGDLDMVTNDQDETLLIWAKADLQEGNVAIQKLE